MNPFAAIRHPHRLGRPLGPSRWLLGALRAIGGHELTSGRTHLTARRGDGRWPNAQAPAISAPLVKAALEDLGDPVALRPSELAMVNTATSRARKAGLAIQYAIGDAQRLDFPDESFDRVNCSRVLMHLGDPAAAIAEMTRVLIPGGRIAISEPDFDAMMIDSDNLNIADAVRRRYTARLRNPDIGRRLRRLLLASRLEILRLSGMAFSVTSLQTALDQFRIFDRLEEAVKVGDVGAEEANQWRGWLQAADKANRLFVAPVLFQAIARKPASPPGT